LIEMVSLWKSQNRWFRHQTSVKFARHYLNECLQRWSDFPSNLRISLVEVSIRENLIIFVQRL
jgi:hypothetical protein